jgi:hypothetical protein
VWVSGVIYCGNCSLRLKLLILKVPAICCIHNNMCILILIIIIIIIREDCNLHLEKMECMTNVQIMANSEIYEAYIRVYFICEGQMNNH